MEWTGGLVIGSGNQPVTLSTPTDSIIVSPDPAMSQSVNIGLFIEKAAEVTDFIKKNGTTKYTLTGIPASYNWVGWSLTVSWLLSSEPTRFMTINLANEITGGATNSVSITLNNFITPPVAPVNGRVLTVVGSAESNESNNSAVAGPNSTTLTTLSGPNNPSNHFFGSQINFGNSFNLGTVGQVNTNSTYGNNNAIQGQYPPLLSRWHYDITNVSLGAAISINQNQLYMQFGPGGNGWLLEQVASQIDVLAAYLEITKTVDKASALPGEYLNYTLVIKNTGDINADNVVIKDVLSSNLSFVSGSIISTSPFTGTDINTGITLTNSIPPNIIVTVTFKVQITNGTITENPIPNTSTVDYSFTPAVGLNPVSDSNNSNTVTTAIIIGYDFGDAPDTGSGNGTGNYTTLLANNGPNHRIISALSLGINITSETDAYQNATATGDDISKGIQDDCIIGATPDILTGDITYTVPIEYINDTGKSAIIYAWVDFNRNGIFEVNEACTFNVVPTSTMNPRNTTLNFSIPNGTLFTLGDTTFMRIRISTTGLPLVSTTSTSEDSRSIGAAQDGEVEDWIINIVESKILGTVWYDLNCNGLKDPNEPLAEGIEVHLYKNGLPDTLFAITTTDVNGYYEFKNIPNGKYYIKIILPGNYNFTSTNVGTNDTIDSDIIQSTGESLIFPIITGTPTNVVDAGLCRKNIISGQSFFDCDLDGILGSSDKLVCGTRVILYNSAGVKIAEQITDCDGYYEFTNLPAGSYTVQAVPQTGLSLVTAVPLQYYGSKPDTTTSIFSVLLSDTDYTQGFIGLMGTLSTGSCNC
ncbi:MAG: SdrD B-like domain-containing protein [Clostridium sp.]|uniref:SdrD B-like domain-containing protein n=1 Tax=Anaerorhabdus sp. TaxID=1872524 RepID=UPI002FC5F3EC